MAAKFKRYTYNGVTVQATGRRSSTRDDKVWMRTVKDGDGERLVHYADPGMPMRRNNPEARANFMSRHNCDEKRDPLAPGFWACYDWANPEEGKAMRVEWLEKKSVDLDELTSKVRDAWFETHREREEPARVTQGYVETVMDDAVIVEIDGDGYYRVSYALTADGVEFAGRDAWEPVREAWVPDESRMDGGDEGEGAEDDEDAPMLTARSITPETLVNYGAAVKALGDGRVGGYLVVFGDPQSTDLVGDYFTKNTDYGPLRQSAVLYHHGQDPSLGKRALKNAADLEIQEAGVWMEHQLDMRDSYEARIYEMVEKGKQGLSSGTAPHLVERKRVGQGIYEITRWPLGLDASYTPTPAEPRTSVLPLKSLPLDVEPLRPVTSAAPGGADDGAVALERARAAAALEHINLILQEETR